MSDNTGRIFNRWFRISMGVFFIAVGIYYKEWSPFLFAAVFITQGILNRGCHGECFVPAVRKEN